MKHTASAGIVPGCDLTAEAETEEQLIQKVTAHAKEAHGIKEVTPELAAAVRSKITDR